MATENQTTEINGNNWCFSMVHMEKCKGLKSRSFFFRSHQLKHSLKWYGVVITFCHNPTVCPISLENDTPIKKDMENSNLYTLKIQMFR